MTLSEYEKAVPLLQELPPAEVAELNAAWGYVGLAVTGHNAKVSDDFALKIGEAKALHNQLNSKGFVPDSPWRIFSNGEFVGASYVFDPRHRHHIDLCNVLDDPRS